MSKNKSVLQDLFANKKAH